MHAAADYADRAVEVDQVGASRLRGSAMPALMEIVQRGDGRNVVVDAAAIEGASPLGTPGFSSAPPSRGKVAMTAMRDARGVRRHAVRIIRVVDRA